MKGGGADSYAGETEEGEGGGDGEAVGDVEPVEAVEGVHDVGQVGEGVYEFGDVLGDDVVFFAEVGGCCGRAPEGGVWVGSVRD